MDELGRNNHSTVSKIYDALRRHGVNAWFDQEMMEHNIVDQMTSGIDDSVCVVVFVTERYIDKVRQRENRNDNCKTEFHYAKNQKTSKYMLAVPMEPRSMNPSAWKGAVGAILGTELYHANFAYDIDKESAKFEENIVTLVDRIKTVNQRV